ncbi:S26 family signal peptidase [Nocardiopsis aegyptia]|uniref:S26 family signal peptidase n=1 Tax=Nocardiopsis aegyptia TaxID=220378 RepID=UPI00366D0E20
MALIVVLGVTVLAVAGGTGLWSLRRTWLVVDVIGESMAPTFLDGDRVLVRRGGAEALRVGDVIVFGGPLHGDDDRPPEAGRTAMVVKRVAALPGDPVPDTVPMSDGRSTVPSASLVLLGDNADRSIDSRVWGPVRLDGVLGVVVRRMASRRDPVGRGAPTPT